MCGPVDNLLADGTQAAKHSGQPFSAQFADENLHSPAQALKRADTISSVPVWSQSHHHPVRSATASDPPIEMQSVAVVQSFDSLGGSPMCEIGMPTPHATHNDATSPILQPSSEASRGAVPQRTPPVEPPVLGADEGTAGSRKAGFTRQRCRSVHASPSPCSMPGAPATAALRAAPDLSTLASPPRSALHVRSDLWQHSHDAAAAGWRSTEQARRLFPDATPAAGLASQQHRLHRSQQCAAASAQHQRGQATPAAYAVDSAPPLSPSYVCLSLALQEQDAEWHRSSWLSLYVRPCLIVLSALLELAAESLWEAWCREGKPRVQHLMQLAGITAQHLRVAAAACTTCMLLFSWCVSCHAYAQQAAHEMNTCPQTNPDAGADPGRLCYRFSLMMRDSVAELL